MDREAWHTAVHGVTRSRTQLSDCTELNFLTERINLSGTHSNSKEKHPLESVEFKCPFTLQPRYYYLCSVHSWVSRFSTNILNKERLCVVGTRQNQERCPSGVDREKNPSPRYQGAQSHRSPGSGTVLQLQREGGKYPDTIQVSCGHQTRISQ